MHSESLPILERIIRDYHSIREPKYRNADLESLKNYLDTLKVMKPDMVKDQRYLNIMNAISQTIGRMERYKTEKPWLNVSERGINKSIPPVVRKKDQVIEFPFQWVDEKSGHTCEINNNWGARNYMVMDVIGYILLLAKGGDIVPKEPVPIFSDISSIQRREKELVPNDSSRIQDLAQETIESCIDRMKKENHWIKFTDKDFRRNTKIDMSSNEIMNLLLETSRVEFKLTYPVRIKEGKKSKEQFYRMNVFSRLFEFGYIDKDVRNDGVVQSREYYVSFNTILGELFAHNLLSMNYDWLDNRFYSLPSTSQVFYRRFLIHHDYKDISVNLDTIKRRLNLKDSNITNLIATIENNILRPLVEFGLIDSYEKDTEGLNGIKFIIKRTHKIKPKEVTHDPEKSSEDGGSVK